MYHFVTVLNNKSAVNINFISSAMVNPILYGFMSEWMRKHLRSIWNGCCVGLVPRSSLFQSILWPNYIFQFCTGIMPTKQVWVMHFTIQSIKPQYYSGCKVDNPLFSFYSCRHGRFNQARRTNWPKSTQSLPNSMRRRDLYMMRSAASSDALCSHCFSVPYWQHQHWHPYQRPMRHRRPWLEIISVH